MSKGRLKPEDESCIQKNYVYLKENLNAWDIVDYLYQHSVITLDDKEKISKLGLSKSERNEILLRTLLNVGPGDGFKYFLKSLSKQYPHVLQKIEQTVAEENAVDSEKEQIHKLLDNIKDQNLTIAKLKEENDALRITLASSDMMNENLRKDLKTSNEVLEYHKSENVKLFESLAQALKEVDILKEELTKYKNREDTVNDVDIVDDKDAKYKNSEDSVNVFDIGDDKDESLEETRNHTDEFEILRFGEKRKVLGKHDIMILESGNNDKQDLISDCVKNPEHKLSIPNETFSINDLPVGYRHKHLYKFVKSLADLTVKVDVATTSLDRPEFIPGTICPFYFSDIRGQKICRTGSGFIVYIEKLGIENEPKSSISCSCTKCGQSKTPSNTFWRISVRTHSALVYNSKEAWCSTIRLFYDTNDSTSIILDNCVKFYTYNTELTFETCDSNVCFKIEEKRKEFLKYSQKMFCYRYYGEEIFDTIFIVSHPHGNIKRISSAKFQCSNNTSRDLQINFYTGETCPGSTGAPVYHIGKDRLYIHQGTTSEKGLNYCAAIKHFTEKSEEKESCILS